MPILPMTVSRDAAMSLYAVGFRMRTVSHWSCHATTIAAPNSDELMAWLLDHGFAVTLEMSAKEMVAMIAHPQAIGGAAYSMADSLAALVEQIYNLKLCALHKESLDA